MMRAIGRALPYALLFPAILPLVYVDGMFYPYLTAKTLLFRGDAIVALALFLALIFSGASYYGERLRNPLTWLPGGLLAAAYVSSLLGIDFYHSFWSVYDRGDGLLTLTSIIASFYMLVLVLDERMTGRLLRTVAWVGTLVAVFASLQWIQSTTGITFLVPMTSGRIGSTLGNAAFLASYLVISLFVTLIVAQALSRVWRMRAYAAAGLQLFAILASATRGALLALILGTFCALVYVAWRGNGAYRSYARYGLVALIVSGALFMLFREQFVRAPLEIVRRVATISLSDATVESRLFIWNEVGREAMKTPIFGVGAEHIEPIFNRVYDPTALIEQWFDRTHNVYLDYFVQYGAFGLVLYLSILGAFARRAWLHLGSADPTRARVGELLLLLLIVYAAQNFFVFDTVSSLWLFFALFATLFVGEERAMPLVRPAYARYAPGALVLLVLLIPVVWRPLYANLLLGSAYVHHVSDVNRSVGALEKGLSLDTYADLEYGYQLYEMYSERQMTMLQGAERMKAYQFARDTLEKNLVRYPYDARTATYLAHVLDLAPLEARDEGRTREVAERALTLSPNRIQPWYIKTNLVIRAGDALPPEDPQRAVYYREGIAILMDYAQMLPTFAEPRFVIATLYLTLGNPDEAAEWAEEGLERYEPDENTARRASRYYVLTENWPLARDFLQDVVDASEPVDYYALYDLAKAEFILGNVDTAGELVARLQAGSPGLYETDQAFVAALETVAR
jgi:O-antigen ligase/tetratricopeptide (TPR) repeat protein